MVRYGDKGCGLYCASLSTVEVVTEAVLDYQQ